MKMKNIICVAIALGIMVFLGLTFFNKKNDMPFFKTEPLRKGDITEYVTASGTIEPVVTTTVGTQVSGIIQEIYVDYNSKVKKDQVLAIIDPDTLIANVKRAQANLNAAKAEYEKCIAKMKYEKNLMERRKTLLEEDLIPKYDYETTETDYISAKASVNAAKAQIEQAAADLNNAQTNLRYTKIKSPTNGIIISKAVEVGQTVAASFTTPELFTVAEDLTKMRIITNISEADISKIKEGQNVDFTVDSYPEESFKGVVSQVRNDPQTTQNVVTYDVVIDVNNENLKLKPGMTANTSIITNQKKNIFLVKNDGLKFMPNNDPNAFKYKQKGLWILKNNHPSRVDIKTGISDDLFTEIISDELKEGDRVITGTAGGKDAANSREPKGKPPKKMGMF